MKMPIRMNARKMAWALAAAACGAGAAPPGPPPAVLVAVSASPLPPPGGSSDAPELRAQLSPRRYTTLAAEIGARVQRLAVTDGAAIRAGQVLLNFDCSLQQAQLDRARATLDAADKQLATQRRLVELNATGRMEIDQAEAEVAKTRAEMTQIQVQLGKCQVLAPFSGRVAEQRVREQQYVQAGQPLLEVLDDSVLEVEFIMPSRWLQSVRVGSTVQVAVDETGKTYAAKVQRLGARVDPVSQSVKVVAAIEGGHAELIAGMSGKVLVARRP
ncbi:MAG TPA: efflux RND transporter periplasmic adaptor subunit [Burkholderiaceae bacterium]|nr:efflux RND transporter periplasmic adaptor subunit [Burkholderiaceae bacterium]